MEGEGTEGGRTRGDLMVSASLVILLVVGLSAPAENLWRLMVGLSSHVKNIAKQSVQLI